MSISPIFWITVTLLFCSLTLLLAGFRPPPPAGRTCRRCAYRLDAVENALRCPECGASTQFAIDGNETDWSGRRRSFRRIGVLGVLLTGVILLGTLFVDAKRIGITPTWFLANVDARLMPYYGPTAETVVIAELHDRMQKGEIGDDRIQSLVAGIVEDLPNDDPRWTSAAPLLFWAWTNYKIAWPVLTDCEPLWPEFQLEFDRFATVDRMPLDLRQRNSWSTSLKGQRSGIRMEIDLLEVRVDGVPTSGEGASFDSRWPTTTPMRESFGPDATGLDLEPGEYDVEIDIEVAMKNQRPARGLKHPSMVRSGMKIDVRRTTLRERLTVWDIPEPHQDPTQCDRWRSELETFSWGQRTGLPPGVEEESGRVFLATASTPPIPAGEIRVELPELPDWEVTSVLQFPQHVDAKFPQNPGRAQRCPRSDSGGAVVEIAAIVFIRRPMGARPIGETLRLRISTPTPDGPGRPDPDADGDAWVYMDCDFEIGIPAEFVWW